MKTEIRQNGKVILSSTDDISIPMIFKNLCGKNFSGNDYQNYLRTVCQDIGVTTGAILKTIYNEKERESSSR